MSQPTAKRSLESAERRLRALEKQLTRCELGKASVIKCPYCQTLTHTDVPQEEFSVGQCCPQMATAFVAIMKRKVTLAQISNAAHIAERWSEIIEQEVRDQVRLVTQ